MAQPNQPNQPNQRNTENITLENLREKALEYLTIFSEVKSRFNFTHNSHLLFSDLAAKIYAYPYINSTDHDSEQDTKLISSINISRAQELSDTLNKLLGEGANFVADNNGSTGQLRLRYTPSTDNYYYIGTKLNSLGVSPTNRNHIQFSLDPRQANYELLSYFLSDIRKILKIYQNELIQSA